MRPGRTERSTNALTNWKGNSTAAAKGTMKPRFAPQIFTDASRISPKLRGFRTGGAGGGGIDGIIATRSRAGRTTAEMATRRHARTGGHCVMCGHIAAPPPAQMARPTTAAHSASLPNSSRHAHRRRVVYCSRCSSVYPMAPWI